jgi:putative transposase
MPWRHPSPMDPKTQFIADDLRARLAMTELCELYGVSRQTGYTWIDRDLTPGPQGLDERSRRPHTSPRHTPDHVVAAILDARRRHPSWGAKKLVALLSPRHPHWPWPARSTVCDLLSRHGLVPKRRPRRALGHPGRPTSHIDAPHEVWSAAFNGHFKTGDGHYCDPLPIADGHSRFLLGCQARSSTRVAEAKPVFTRLFKACGLPQRLRTDHGVPFAPSTLGRRSRLSAWWVRLGILPEVIEPGKPQQNGRHERRHRTLKAETTRPPARTRRAQQLTCDRFRAAFNDQRPHEALDLHTPASRDEPSPRQMPNRLPPLESPDRLAGREVSANGGIRWHQPWGNVSHTCIGAYVGLEDIDDGLWTVSFGPLTLGRLLERHRRIEEASGRLKRRR